MSTRRISGLGVAVSLLIVCWGAIVLVINPVGDFMVNDDWSFTRTLEDLLHEGRLAPTGWGPAHAPGGPALIAQLAWTLPFSFYAGSHPTVLRIAVLILAALGSIGLIVLLKALKTPAPFAFFGALVLILNPLFLSQAFSFMTDVPFVAFITFSLLFICLGIQRARLHIVVIGLLFSLCAILTRQIGLVVPGALVVAAAIHANGRGIGRIRLLLVTVGVTVIPWVAFETYLMFIGSTPLFEHQVIHKIFLDPISKGFLDYVGLLGSRLVCALAYGCFFVSPLLVAFPPANNERPRRFRLFLWISLLLFAIGEIGLLVGLLELPVAFYWNTIFDFGIGPVLLKDTYILGISRTWSLPNTLFLAIVYVAFLSTAVIVRRLLISLGHLLKHDKTSLGAEVNFFSLFCVMVLLIYLTVILFTGFHDRYLIPVNLFLIVWIFAGRGQWKEARIPPTRLALSVLLLILIGAFSVLGVRDFMTMKRSLAEAHRYLVQDLGINPCHMDGGFEFNGYHCYDSDFEPKPGLSWWWVEREDYLVTLGPLPEYEVIRVFRFRRCMGSPGGVHVLRAARKGAWQKLQHPKTLLTTESRYAANSWNKSQEYVKKPTYLRVVQAVENLKMEQTGQNRHQKDKWIKKTLPNRITQLED